MSWGVALSIVLRSRDLERSCDKSKATQAQAGKPTLESRHDDEGFCFNSFSEPSTLVVSQLHHLDAV